ncbi:MAG: HAD family hydrolase [Vicinamibacterales bacterium]
MIRRLLLFDIDGTLVLTGGAGRRAMELAFLQAFGIADAFAGVPMAGRTDRWLAGQALERHGLPVTSSHLERFRAGYLEALASSIHEGGQGRRGVMPGVEALLDRLARHEDVRVALLTGNYAEGARIKLEHFGLWHRFAWGMFGDEHAERDALAQAAMAAAPGHGVSLAHPSHAVVIGDTPFDIACARAAGARVIAVATGGHTREALQACRPDLVLDDLTDAGAVDALIGS